MSLHCNNEGIGSSKEVLESFPEGPKEGPQEQEGLQEGFQESNNKLLYCIREGLKNKYLFSDSKVTIFSKILGFLLVFCLQIKPLIPSHSIPFLSNPIILNTIIHLFP